MVVRLVVVWLAAASIVSAACGGSATRSTNADLIRQPTPDPTLDAVVRDLPHALAGIAPTATPTPAPILVTKPKPKPLAPTQGPPRPAATVPTKPTPTSAPTVPPKLTPTSAPTAPPKPTPTSAPKPAVPLPKPTASH
jgi:hypothetical protein